MITSLNSFVISQFSRRYIVTSPYPALLLYCYILSNPLLYCYIPLPPYYIITSSLTLYYIITSPYPPIILLHPPTPLKGGIGYW